MQRSLTSACLGLLSLTLSSMVTGPVVDASGAAIPKAVITLRSALTNYSQAATSGSDGSSRLVNIPPNPDHGSDGFWIRNLRLGCRYSRFASRCRPALRCIRDTFPRIARPDRERSPAGNPHRHMVHRFATWTIGSRGYRAPTRISLHVDWCRRGQRSEPSISKRLLNCHLSLGKAVPDSSIYGSLLQPAKRRDIESAAARVSRLRPGHHAPWRFRLSHRVYLKELDEKAKRLKLWVRTSRARGL
jgi:hypothetical protein